MLKLHKKQSVEYREGEVPYKFTFTRVSSDQDMRHQGYRAIGAAFIKERTGMDADKVYGTIRVNSRKREDQEAMATGLAALAWGRILASLESIHEWNEESQEWQETPIPDEWRDIEQFVATVPSDLVTLLDGVACDCNRELWFVEETPRAKKKGRENAKSS